MKYKMMLLYSVMSLVYFSTMVAGDVGSAAISITADDQTKRDPFDGSRNFAPIKAKLDLVDLVVMQDAQHCKIGMQGKKAETKDVECLLLNALGEGGAYWNEYALNLCYRVIESSDKVLKARVDGRSHTEALEEFKKNSHGLRFYLEDETTRWTDTLGVWYGGRKSAFGS